MFFVVSLNRLYLRNSSEHWWAGLHDRTTDWILFSRWWQKSSSQEHFFHSFFPFLCHTCPARDFVFALPPHAVQCFLILSGRDCCLCFKALLQRYLLVSWGTSLVLLPPQKRDHKRILTADTLPQVTAKAWKLESCWYGWDKQQCMLYYGLKLGIGHTHAHTRSLTRELSMTVHGFALVNIFNIRVIFSIGHYLIGILCNISRVFH